MLYKIIILNFASIKNSDDKNENNKVINENQNIKSDASSEAIITNKQQYYRDKILHLADFNEAFELVKSTVEAKFKIHRAGLTLILQGLPTNVGAYHVLGSNIIIVNKRILGILKRYKSNEEYNSYLFMVLVHEYLHSLGIIDELQVRNMTYVLIASLVGEDHAAANMARYQPWDLFPELNLFHSNSFEQNFEIVKNFDKATQSYIG
jgi:hypothetical protein